MEEKLVKSDSGVNIYCYNNPVLHGFFISLFVKAGVIYEAPSQYGITHFLEHVAIRNVNAVMNGRLYAELDRSGIEFNASTYSEMVQFYVSGASECFGAGAEIITKLFCPLKLGKGEIDAERRRIKAEIRESDDKSSLAGFTNKIVFEGTPLESSIIGTNCGIDRISAKSLEAYRSSVMNRSNIFFYVTGSFLDSDIRRLAELIDCYSIPDAPPRRNSPPIPQGFGKRGPVVAVKNADYTMLRFTFDIDMSRVDSCHLDLIYDMLLSGYNSRLFIELSEKKGLFYDIGGAAERYANIGSLNFSFELKEKDVEQAVATSLRIVSELKRPEVVAKECVRAGYVDNALMLLDDARELNFTLAYDNHVLGMGYKSVEQRKNRYEAITAEELSLAAREIFRPENLTVTLKGNKKKINPERIRAIALSALV